MINLMFDDLNDRSQTYFCNNLVKAATLLDVRYRKLTFIKSQVERDKFYHSAVVYIKKLAENYLSKEKDRSSQQSNSIREPDAKKRKKENDFDICCYGEIETDEIDSNDDFNNKICAEISLYMKTKYDFDSSTNPLHFFKDNITRKYIHTI